MKTLKTLSRQLEPKLEEWINEIKFRSIEITQFELQKEAGKMKTNKSSKFWIIVFPDKEEEECKIFKTVCSWVQWHMSLITSTSELEVGVVWVLDQSELHDKTVSQNYMKKSCLKYGKFTERCGLTHSRSESNPK